MKYNINEHIFKNLDLPINRTSVNSIYCFNRLLGILKDKYKKNVVILVDEYDKPLQE